MSDPSTVALRLLELVVLLFPVVALLLQLQSRAAESDELKRLALLAGAGLLSLLSFAFLVLSGYLLVALRLPVLLATGVLFLAVTSVVLPLIIVLASDSFLDTVTGLYERIVDWGTRLARRVAAFLTFDRP